MAIRVHDLAKELKISSAALMKHLQDMSIEVKSHMKYLDEEIADKVRQKFKHEIEQMKRLESERRLIQEQLRKRDKREKDTKQQIVENPFKDMTIPKQEEQVKSPFQEVKKETTEHKSQINIPPVVQNSVRLDGEGQNESENKSKFENRDKRKERPDFRENKQENKGQKTDVKQDRHDDKTKTPYKHESKDRTREPFEHRKDKNKERQEKGKESSGSFQKREHRHDSHRDKQDDRFQRLDRPEKRDHKHDHRDKKQVHTEHHPKTKDDRQFVKTEKHENVNQRQDKNKHTQERPVQREKQFEHKGDRKDDRYQRTDRNENRENRTDTGQKRQHQQGDRQQGRYQRPDSQEKRHEHRGERQDGRQQKQDRNRPNEQRPDNRNIRQDTRGDRQDNRFQRQDRTDNKVNRTDNRTSSQGFQTRPRNENYDNKRPHTSTDRFTPRPLFPKPGIIKPESKDNLDKQFGKDKVNVVDLGDKSKHIQAKLKNTKNRKKETTRPEIDESLLEKNIKTTLANQKKRKKHKREDKKVDIEDIHEISISEFTSVSELAKIIDVSPSEIISRFFQMGKMVSINQRLDRDSLELICAEYELEIHFQDEFGAELIQDIIDDLENVEEKPRPPVVTIMGHVDHGKTSILDKIRNTKVAIGESGGITQHIGAYQAVHNDQRVTFIDTPGHEAFTAMRERGANVTDVAVIVVAANDGVKPQTVEAIDHARAAGVTLVIAINKIDLPEANVEKTIASLLELNVFLEGYGGQIPYVKCSAIKGDGIDELLEIILLSAEMKELKARVNGPGKGIVLEAEKNSKMGSKATILLQEGVLKKGDNIVVGSCYGNVRKMENERTIELMSIQPSDIAVVYGLNNVPKAGDILNAVESEKVARQIGGERLLIRQEREKYLGKTNLGNLFTKIRQHEMTDLRLIVKADVDGSMEAVCDSLQKLSTDEIKISIIRKSVGGIIEADVNLASASEAVIIGFNVRANNKAKKLADETGVEIKHYHIIFEAIDDIKKAMLGMLSPEYQEKILGQALVKQLFKMKKIGTIAGCSVEKGFIQSKSSVRLFRDDKVIFTGEISNLKHYQDDVKEVVSGTECGITIKNYNDIKEGDIIECFILEEVERQEL